MRAVKHLFNIKNTCPNKKTISSKKISLIGLTSLLCAFSGQAIAKKHTECNAEHFYKDHTLLRAQPEFGVDLGFTRTQFKHGQGDKMLNRNQMPINVFFGLNFTEHFGFEVGYGETRRKHKTVTLVPGEIAPGADEVGINEYQIYDTSLSISQPYISLKYKHPIGEKVQLFGAVGITAMKINASWENIADQTGAPPQEPVFVTFRSKTINLRKTIPLVKVGLYCPLVNSFSLRLVATWLKTSNFQTYIPASGPGAFNNPMNINMKNSIQYSLGIVYII